MPRAFRITLAVIGLMVLGCTDPATLPNDIQALDDVTNTNMPAVRERGVRTVGVIVMAPVIRPSASPTPQPTPRPTAAPTPAPSPTGPLQLP